MGQVSRFLRKSSQGHFHWCPGCCEMHILPNTWNFDGNLEKPTFTPSFKHSGFQKEIIDYKWAGNWVKDQNGQLIPFTCHYILTNGVLNYCLDSTHLLAGKSVPLPELPDYYQDPK